MNLKNKKFITTKSSLLLGGSLIIIGILIIFGFQISPSSAFGKKTPSFRSIESTIAPLTNVDTPTVKGIPAHIDIPSVSISLNVIPGYYYPVTKTWTLSLNDAQYGTMTEPANNKQGETFIYAHNRKGVFQNLPKITPGSMATITTDNGHVFAYTFRTSTITNPADISLFSYTGKPILVAQTCTGNWYQDRQLFIFDFKEVV